MRLHSIIHAPFEKPGIITDWANEKGFQISETHTYRGEQLPAPSAFDFLIIMGGPQSPLECDRYPYIKDEINLTKSAINHKKFILGFCLGAQIIGEALGAATERSPNKEVGIFPITLTDAGTQDPIFKNFSPVFDVIHWHNDMPGIPEGAELLAKSDGCPKQAFRYGDRVYALQFHMEITASLLKGMVEHCPGDLKPGKYIQSAHELSTANVSDINEKMIFVLDYLAKQFHDKI
ncbi:MAG: homoserine O-succinyltransferase [Proteobacteria bacterium]|nr:homoserine O-succinyltransferase [Pseudomonadota bacterium]